MTYKIETDNEGPPERQGSSVSIGKELVAAALDDQGTWKVIRDLPATKAKSNASVIRKGTAEWIVRLRRNYNVEATVRGNPDGTFDLWVRTTVLPTAHPAVRSSLAQQRDG